MNVGLNDLILYDSTANKWKLR